MSHRLQRTTRCRLQPRRPAIGPPSHRLGGRFGRLPRRRQRRRRLTATVQDPPGAHPRSPELARIEAVLFVAREPVSIRRLVKLAGLPDGSRARVLLRDLQQLHDAEGAAFRIEHIGGGFQLLTRSPLGPWVRRLLASPAETRISAAALETLAIIAYRQPVTRADIEAIRGVGSEDMLRQLLDRDLVAVGGRTEDLGRPNVYLTTRRFLRAFGLARIEDLPPIAPPAPLAASGEPRTTGEAG